MNTAPRYNDAYIRGVALGFPKGDSRRDNLMEIADRMQRLEEWRKTYKKPKEGWTCFHCGDTFTTPGAARIHFGASIEATASCQIKAGAELGILMALRKAEEELAHYREEDQPVIHEMARLQSRHSDALRGAEELGYSRGLKDYAALEAVNAELKTKHEAACGTIQQQRADIDTIRGYLDTVKASHERNAISAQLRINDLYLVIEEVHAWAVCGAITSPEDMMQNLPRIAEITTLGPTDTALDVNALVKALQYGVDIHTPGRVDGLMHHHLSLWLAQANSVLTLYAAEKLKTKEVGA